MADDNETREVGPREAHSSLCQSLHQGYPLLGLSRVHHTNKRGQPMSFADKPYLIHLYHAMPTIRDAVFCKGVQTGLSELLIQLVLYQAGWEDRICAYVLPQYKTCERFVADRVDPLLLRTPAYRARLPGGERGLDASGGSKGNLKRKRFGRNGSILFLGSNTESDFLEFSADLAIVDEYDACDLGNIAKIGDRVKESDHPQVIKVSNPRIPGRGVQRMWKEGTQARWYHQCERCGRKQYLDWFTHFAFQGDGGVWLPRDTERLKDPGAGDLRPVCSGCDLPFERRADGGVWVSSYPDRMSETFHMSRLDVLSSNRDPQPIRAIFSEWVLAQGDPRRLEAFWAGNLGWPYASAGSRVTDLILDRAMEGQRPLDHNGSHEYEDHTLVMGVDVGSVINVFVDRLELDETGEGYVRENIWIGAVLNFEDLYDIQDRYHVDVMVIDARPETRKAKEVRDHFIENGECQVWLCEYVGQGKVGADAFGLTLKYEEQVVQVDRTQLLDTCLAELENRTRRLASDASTVLGFREQMRAPVRVLNEKSQRFVWEEGTDPDHYRHADAYSRVAQEIHDRSGAYWE